MSAIKLCEGVWSVGVLNPSLRVFDIVMESRYGTSYNAYLLTGEKNVLIETVHKDYWEEFVSNIRQVIPLEKLDYLIMNHTEPDHSGSVAALLEHCPNLKVLCSNAAKKFLCAISNKDFDCQVVKDGDTLDLGSKTLQFISAPLLHWPDSMFTWDPVDKALFTCDFLGAHFCEPTMRDTGIHREYLPYYDVELRNYFNCIFGPFKPSVLAGLDKMPADVEMVCTSHGPVLTERIGKVKDLYRRWAAPEEKGHSQKTAAILYCSAYGCTRALAEAAARALADAGLWVCSADVVFEQPESVAGMVNSCDVLLFGSPTINKGAPGAIWNAVHAVDAINTKGRSAGAFGSFGWSGEAPDMLHSQLVHLKFKTPEKPFKVNFTPTEADLATMADYAKAVAGLI